ncbi:MAG: hypothetical protein K2P40_05905, partial [Lachnospiraceae bacterium]|nr:hypothetical protein [Lachnospiraceae bacterium]
MYLGEKKYGDSVPAGKSIIFIKHKAYNISDEGRFQGFPVTSVLWGKDIGKYGVSPDVLWGSREIRRMPEMTGHTPWM